MQVSQPADVSRLLSNIYTEVKFWIPAISGLWGIFKIVEWVKRIKTNDLHHIQLGLDELRKDVDKQTTQLNANMKDQTDAIVNELKESRSDMRTLISALLRKE